MNEGKRCSVCKKDWNEVDLYEGVLGSEMVMVCKGCSEGEGIPLIQIPTHDQVKRSIDQRSVRERMERLSGMRETTEIGTEQETVQRNLNKLKSPIKKETNPFVVENHYWTSNMGRRRKKLSLNQAAEAMEIDSQLLQEIEHGKIPQNFDEIFPKLEKLYGIKLLKNQQRKIHFIKTVEEEKRVLDEVKEKMQGHEKEIRKYEKEENTQKKKEAMQKGELDFSNKEVLEDITLNDLVEMKKKKKRIEESKRIRKEVEAMVGEDLDLDLEELE
jgi:ribosome-binding protein aMBF1 (putative translation factor)